MHWIDYIPIFTTLFSIYFLYQIIPHYRMRRTPYLLWWAIGVLTFGLGTLAESVHALIGWNEYNLRIWYIVGALLGGFPLAQGSVYLLMSKRMADASAWFFSILIVVAAAFVIISPINLPVDFNGQLSGKVFEWKWVRYFSPLINIYSFLFLVGGAFYSAWRYYRLGDRQSLFKGNILIALGGLLPGIGGSFTRAGYVHVLFVTELLGLLLIFAGYVMVRGAKQKAKNPAAQLV